MIAAIFDIVTGSIGTIKGHRPWDFVDGNWSCDCNRNIYNVEVEGYEYGVCKGGSRFVVVKVEHEPLVDINEYGDNEFEMYSLEDMHIDYSKELLNKIYLCNCCNKYQVNDAVSPPLSYLTKVFNVINPPT